MRRLVGLLSGMLLYIGLTGSGLAEEGSSTAASVAKSYFRAMDAGDLDAAAALFADTSLIFETGGVEGSWQQYRDHHIGPEIAAIDTFLTTLGDPEEGQSADRSMALVAWPIEYRIRLKSGELIQSRGTVTFVLMRKDDGYRIRHLHWSSQRKK